MADSPRALVPCVAAVIAASALSACMPAAAPEARQARHFACADRFTGEPVFGFWEDTARDAALVIGGSSYATVTLDNGRAQRVSDADVGTNFDCRIDQTRPWGSVQPMPQGPAHG